MFMNLKCEILGLSLFCFALVSVKDMQEGYVFDDTNALVKVKEIIG